MPRPGQLYIPETGKFYCTECQNLGTVDCHCGGDQCYCGQEEIECPYCNGGLGFDDEIED